MRKKPMRHIFISILFRDTLKQNNKSLMFAKLPEFVTGLLQEIKDSGINVSDLYMDHVCYRVETSEEFEQCAKHLALMGDLLINEVVGGRRISTFKLKEPFVVGDRQIHVIELPMPKEGSFYPTGWEHAEFVISEKLESFANRHTHIAWDYSGLKKPFNADLRVQLKNKSVKFHNLPLETVIEHEKRK